MNASKLAITLAFLVAGTSAFAQSAEYSAPDANFVSTRTRAEVMAELKQAYAEGSYVAGGEEYVGQIQMTAKNLRGRAGAIETAGSKKPFAAPNGG